MLFRRINRYWMYIWKISKKMRTPREYILRVAFLVIAVFCMPVPCACQNSGKKGYDLPVDEDLEAAAESDCIEKMMLIEEIYSEADKGKASNVIIGQETIERMILALQETGCPVMANGFYYNMANYEKMEQFLEASLDGNRGEIVAYDVRLDGGISRKQFIFDGKDMYVLGTSGIWNDKNQPLTSSTTYTRVKKWEYTEKGYFLLEYCVPEPPDVSEVVNGNVLIRVKPQEEKNIEIAEEALLPIRYQGNNLLCSNWDAEHLENLDYNGLFEYLYEMEYKERFDKDKYRNGIPKDDFENLITGYLPVTDEELREYAVYDEENETYTWTGLGWGNYAPNAFRTAYPECIDIQENENGTFTLTIDAVCEMLGSDRVMSHLLTVQFQENGKIRYLSNCILDDGLEKIPTYQYRIR